MADPHDTRSSDGPTLQLFDAQAQAASRAEGEPRHLQGERARVRYIGSKARIVDQIMAIVGPPSERGFFVDAFAGTGVVGEKASELGWPVRLNDHLLSSTVVSAARLLGADAVTFERLGGYDRTIERLNAARPRHGFLWREYSPASLEAAGVERRYFTETNAAKLDAARALIEEWSVEGLVTDDERLLVIADVLSAANRVANIAGTYGCFMRDWLPSALDDVRLAPRRLRSRTPRFEVFTLDVEELPIAETDVAYFDPPYTKRQYAAYYHVLETIAHGDEPSVSGITGLRPWREKASKFCYKTRALEAIVELIGRTPARRIFLSYSSEGHVRAARRARTEACAPRRYGVPRDRPDRALPAEPSVRRVRRWSCHMERLSALLVDTEEVLLVARLERRSRHHATPTCSATAFQSSVHARRSALRPRRERQGPRLLPGAPSAFRRSDLLLQAPAGRHLRV